MTDSVGTLRIFASHRNPSRTMDKKAIAEAADEIERLRAALKLAVFYAQDGKPPTGDALDIMVAALEEGKR